LGHAAEVSKRWEEVLSGIWLPLTKGLMTGYPLLVTGSVPVCPPHGHPILSTTARPAAPRGCQRPRDAPLPPHHCGCGGPGPEEWGHSLLDTGETQVWLVAGGVGGADGAVFQDRTRCGFSHQWVSMPLSFKTRRIKRVESSPKESIFFQAVVSHGK
jgi:hypothetical protein